MHNRFPPIWCLTFLLVWANTGVVAASENPDESIFGIALDTGVAGIDEDIFIPILVEFSIQYKSFELVLSGPFQLRLADRAPQDKNILRDQDWDDESDWARILRHMRFHPFLENGEIDLSLGELNGVHQAYGEIVSHYYNSTDMDHYHGGVSSLFQINGNGLSVLLDDVVNPTILTGYVFAAPIAWFNHGRLAGRLQTGLQIFVDFNAPHRTINRHDEVLLAAGGNISFIAIERNPGQLTTYVSVGAMDGDAGFHGGIVTDFVFSRSKKQGLHFQSEFRYMGSDYYPALMNPFYNHNRRFFSVDPISGQQNTFRDHLSSTTMKVESAPGFMVDLELQLGSVLKVGARYDYQARHRPHWVIFRMQVAPTERLAFSAFYAGQDIGGGNDIFSLDALAGVAYHHQIAGPFQVFAEFSRRFRQLDNNTTSMANELSLGAGIALTL
jgi:hypothetical protein